MQRENSGIVREVSNCRICGCSDLVKYLDLGSLPLANKLAATTIDAKAMRHYPMKDGDLVVDIASTADFSVGGGKYIIPVPAFRIFAPDGEA